MTNYNLTTNIKAQIIWALMFVVFNTNAQNLVPNYSFEQHTICNSVGGQGATSWLSPLKGYNILNQYSYFNICSSSKCCGVPSYNFGYGWQFARTGFAFADFWFTNNDGKNQRIYIQSKLYDSLKKNHCYYIEFYVNLFNFSLYANNNISLLVGDTGIVSYNGQPAYTFPQIQQYGNPCITDTLNWVKVGGIYTAHGGEQYITIGNFTDDAHTDTLRVLSVGSYSAYNIDDVSVMPLDSMQLKAEAGRDTTIIKGDSVWIGSRLCGLTNVVWYDAANNVIDTGAPGMWVKPTSNTFYVIEQDVCGQYSRDTVYITVAPLPVTLLSFNVIASAAKQSESINWETASEINTSHFNIQRSEDGSTFYTIGTVKAKGPSTYNFNDPLTTHDSRFTTLYYRLEIVDKNNSKTYSEIRSVFLTNNDSRYTISPNPAKDFISINAQNIKEVKITDASGRLVIKSTKTNIDISTLQKGVYFLEIITNNCNEVKKFIKQ